MSALVLVFPDDDGYSVLPFFWVPEEGARQRERRDRVPYGDWVREEFMEATPGEVVDYDRIRTRIVELGKQYDIRQVAIDRWNATQLATQLSGDGFEMVAFGQGYASMSAPTKKLEEVVLANAAAARRASRVAVDGWQRLHRARCGRQLETVQEEKLRADRWDRGAHHGAGSGGQDGGFAQYL